ncbi:universal stress protein [Phytopseudomonas dryadis]|uniref:Universal stress protein n=1 Tax=Phytopseudomonas dryadis TaxID=2487520 RepID=A0ABY1ZA47_9GAMM|nr:MULTISPECIES: universal stress protein [Pseudomonas]TBV08581.1 universal stress protein [Pseudomonas dryadis]TBV18949.1 universal stress protein [Pseudomonas sp. FRB 230]
MFTHILIAHDLRDTAEMALRRAAQLARQHGARLSVLHVLDPTQSEQQHEHARQVLDRSIGQHAPPDSALHLRSGKPSEVVLQLLGELDCDLLVLGAHHQRHDFFSGTSLDRISRHCPVALLLVARNAFDPYERALAAIDFSLCACSALAQGYRLLPEEAELHAVHVFEADKGTPEQRRSQLQIQQALIDQLLHDEAQKLPEIGPRLSHSLHEGGILRCLQQQLRSRRSEVLILGSHGRGALSQALLGSLAQHFLHKAPCDVFVVR